MNNGTTRENYDSFDFRKFTAKSEFDKAIHTLEGFLSGINYDNTLDIAEIKELKHWCEKYSWFLAKPPFNELVPLIEEALSDNILSKDEIDDILWLCNNFTYESQYYNLITSDIQRLHGIIYGIMSDGLITEAEIKALDNWIVENEHLATFYPYDELNSMLTAILSDGKITNEEMNTLKVFLSDFIDKDSNCINRDEIEILRKECSITGLCAVSPEIIFENKTFCFTGASSKTNRKTFADTIESIGCTFKDNVTKSVDYLIIGNDGNPCWTFSCYGRKVETAVKLRKSGSQILIIHENDFWDAFDNL